MKNLLIVIGLIVVVALGYWGYKSAYKPMPATQTNSPAVATNQVEMKNFAFSPTNISVSVGSEVTFTNNDSTTHNIVADDGSFTSGPLAPGKTFKQTFSAAGIISYHCSIHPSMTGKIEVK